jgi:hypothetical protein
VTTVSCEDSTAPEESSEARYMSSDGRSVSLRPGALDLAAAALVVLLPVAFWPGFETPDFLPKYAVLLLVVALGLPLLCRLATRSPLAAPARALVAFLAVGLLSALVSASPLTGVFGIDDWGTGWLFWCGVCGAFAIGASLSALGRRSVGNGLLVASGLNVLVGILQMASGMRSGPLALYNGNQADGLFGNPVHFEALVAGALVLVGWRCCAEDARWAALALPLAAGLQLSRERFAIALVLGVVVLLLVRFRSPAALLAGAATVAGYGATWAASGVLSRSSVTGVVDVAGTPRLLAWKDLLHAMAHRVLVGWGPGETRTAFFSAETLATARHLTPGGYFADAHDVFLEIGVTTGLLGLAAIAVFAVFVVRCGARGPFVWFALALLSVELVEPLNVAVTPLAALALGAALGRAPMPACAVTAPAPPRPALPVVARRFAGRAVAGALVAAAVLASTAMLIGGFDSGSDSSPGSLARLQMASRLLPIWPDTALAVADRDEQDASGVDVRAWYSRTRQAALDAVSRDVTDPSSWIVLATAEMQLGDLGAARRDYLAARRWSAWSPGAVTGLGLLAATEGSCSVAARDFQLDAAWAASSFYIGLAERAALRQCAEVARRQHARADRARG